MAKPIKLGKGKEFTFAPAGGGGQASKYPWDEWFATDDQGQGKLLLLEQSEGTKDEKGTVTGVTSKKDYEVDTNAMPAKLKTAARRRYKVVQVSRRDADGNKLVDSIIIRARDMDDDERTAEDLLRAEEKAEADAKRKAGKSPTAREAVATSNAAIDAANASGS